MVVETFGSVVVPRVHGIDVVAIVDIVPGIDEGETGRKGGVCW